MKRFILIFVCLVGIIGSSTTLSQNIAEDKKPPITMPTSHEDIG